MRAAAKQQDVTPQSGFAIVVVLASLLILTTLFAIASQRSMTHIQTQTAERYLANRQADDAAILALLRDIGPDAVAAESITLSQPFDDVQLRIQDVGGLIDLNTAAPELLEMLFAALDFPPDAARDFRQWRREGRRLVRVDDVIRITGAELAVLGTLKGVATVFSGRRGIAPALAPEGVKAVALGRANTLPEALISPPSNTNFAIYHDTRLIGVISIGGQDDQPRILELR